MQELLTRPGFWLAAYLAVMNLAAFWASGADKRRARRGSWRMLGMHVFRHKTRHWYFRWGIPAIFLLQLAACGAVWYLGR